jgi:flavodoxin
MKTLVIYDSLYGNTKIVAGAIAEAIAEVTGDQSGDEVKLVHVTEADVSTFSDYDLLVVGGPTQQANPSPPVKELLDVIPARALNGVKVAAFDTRMTQKWILIFGTAAPKIAKSLKAKGGLQVGKAIGFFVTGGEGPLKEGEIERAAAWAKGVAGDAV